MKRPNFFIAGAPKCGTTALYEYLKTHPQVFLPDTKEPNYFCDDHCPSFRLASTETAYLERFYSRSGDRHSAVGDASVSYLHSKTAISNIKAFDPSARIITMFRNPADMVYALHSENLFNLHEVESDFVKAWQLEPFRARGLYLPPRCAAPHCLLYRSIAHFGEQLQRVYEHFPPKQVKVIFYENLKTNTSGVYTETLAFLGLAADGRTDFPVVNGNKRHRFPGLGKLLQDLPDPALTALDGIRKMLEVKSLGVGRWLNRANLVSVPRAPLAESTRAEIASVLRSDVELLEELTGRDLSAWKTGRSERTASGN